MRYKCVPRQDTQGCSIHTRVYSQTQNRAGYLHTYHLELKLLFVAPSWHVCVRGGVGVLGGGECWGGVGGTCRVYIPSPHGITEISDDFDSGIEWMTTA